MDADQQARAKTIGAGRDLLRELCARVLRKEHKAMVRAAEKSPEDFETAVGEFYADHSTYIEATLGESLRTLWAARVMRFHIVQRTQSGLAQGRIAGNARKAE